MEVLRKLCRCSYLFQHFSRRYEHFKKDHFVKSSLNFMIDVFCGYFFSLAFKTLLLTENVDVHGYMIFYRDRIREFLEDLISWLMAVPAGLKLNHELSHFLGNFFLSHIYIWIGYLHVIEPYIPLILRVVEAASYLGLTIIFSLVNDVIGMLTCHIYCFYVYAAKLYSVQLRALISLARLFMGRKWNVLRLRVDSVTYEADQLILGTILFTILLFLLPTSLLYYVVFASLRMSVYLLQSSLSVTVVGLSKLPVDQLVTKFKYDFFRICGCSVGLNRKHELPSYCGMIYSCFDDIHPDIINTIKKLCTGGLVNPWTSLRIKRTELS